MVSAVFILFVGVGVLWQPVCLHAEEQTCDGGRANCEQQQQQQQHLQQQRQQQQQPSPQQLDEFSFPHVDASQDYNKLGIHQFEAHDLEAAEQYFRAAVLHSPDRGDVWTNLCNTMHKACTIEINTNKQSNKPPSKRTGDRLSEAAAACEVGALLGQYSPEMAKTVRSTFQKSYSKRKCMSTRDCTVYNKEIKALELQIANNHIDAAKLLCGKASRLTIKLTHVERTSGVFSAETMRRMLILLRVCGVVAIDRAIDPHVVDVVANTQRQSFDVWLKSGTSSTAANTSLSMTTTTTSHTSSASSSSTTTTTTTTKSSGTTTSSSSTTTTTTSTTASSATIPTPTSATTSSSSTTSNPTSWTTTSHTSTTTPTPRNSNANTNDMQWVNAAQRSPGRFETKYPMELPYTNPRFAANRFVLQLIKSQLGRRFEIDTFSAVTSLPRATEQGWHADVSPLFVRKLQGGVEKNPPFGLVSLVPLVDMEDALGYTEFYVGSHVNLPPGDLFQTDASLTHHITFKLKKGGAIIFDMRLRHHGLANKSKKNRPVSYTSYVRDWYHDVTNFKSRHTREFDSLATPADKKLFSKVDNEAYIQQLEAIVKRDHPGVLEGLRSVGGYKQADLIV